ncbi:MAG: DMT family transporter [Eubacteriales bacterium]|nr:DMT family transporter [Eubacteriales bacterium]
MNASSIKKGYVQVFIAGFFWGTTGLFMELLAGAGASNSLVSLLRVGTAALIMFPVVWNTCGLRALRIDGKTLLMCSAMGFTAHTLFNICYTAAVASVGVATAAVLLYASLFFVCILSRIIFKEMITKFKVIALVVNIIGCTLTVTGGDLDALSFIFFGTIMGLTAALGYSTVPIFGKITTGYTHPYVITFYNFLFGALFLLPFLAAGAPVQSQISVKVLGLGLGAGLVSAVIPYMLFMSGLAKPVETSKVNVIASMEVVVAALIGAGVFHEFMNGWKLVGMALVLSSILIMNLSPALTAKSEMQNE